MRFALVFLGLAACSASNTAATSGGSSGGNGAVLDAAFGTGGTTTTNALGLSGASVSALSVDTQGRLYVALVADQTQTLVRFTPIGTLDASFAVGGVLNYSGWLAIQPDGSLFVAKGGDGIDKYSAAQGAVDPSYTASSSIIASIIAPAPGDGLYFSSTDLADPTQLHLGELDATGALVGNVVTFTVVKGTLPAQLLVTGSDALVFAVYYTAPEMPPAQSYLGSLRDPSYGTAGLLSLAITADVKATLVDGTDVVIATGSGTTFYNETGRVARTSNWQDQVCAVDASGRLVNVSADLTLSDASGNTTPSSSALGGATEWTNCVFTSATKLVTTAVLPSGALENSQWNVKD